MSTLSTLLQPDDILLDLEVVDKPRLFEVVGWHMEQAHAMPQGWVAVALSRRERIGSTALGHGIAIPHARVRDLERIQLAYVRLKSPIWFNAPDDRPVTDVLVILVPQQASEEHLRILSEATQMFSDQRFRERLAGCHRPLEVKQLFDDWLLPS